MRTLLATPRAVLWACAGLIAIVWLDVLDLMASLALLNLPGYSEANAIAYAGGAVSLAAVKLLIPIALGLLLLWSYRQPRLFRVVTLVLWLAVLPYVAVVTHNLLLLLAR